MRRMKDPFPRTPTGFHDRVERTLSSLGAGREAFAHPRAGKALLIAAIILALLAATAIAAALNSHRLKSALLENGAQEVAELVRDVGFVSDGDRFSLSVDEILWEGEDLFISYSLSVPGDGQRYLAAMFTPSLNGVPLDFSEEAMPMHRGCFFDRDGAVVPLGGEGQTALSDTLPFAAQAASSENRLDLVVVFLRTDRDFGTFKTSLSPLIAGFDAVALEDDPEVSAALATAAGEGEGLSVEALERAGIAGIVARREIHATLPAPQARQAVLEDLAQRVYDIGPLGCRVEVTDFRLSHLGYTLEMLVTVPDAADAKEAGSRLNDFTGLQWWLMGPDGADPGWFVSGGASGAREYREDGTPVWRMHMSAYEFIPLKGLDQLWLVPWEMDENGDSFPRMDCAIPLVWAQPSLSPGY